ncbi:MAG: leucine-rich repeat domain-containing protein, partial [Clostridia bacterium]
MTNRMSKWLLGVLVMLLMLGSAVAMAAEWIRPWTGDPRSVKVTGALAPETAISIDDKTQVLCYTFIPTENDVYRIYSTGAADSYMYLYDDKFGRMAEEDDTEIDTNFSVCCNMKRGRTYYCYFTAYPNGGVEASYRVFVGKAPRTDDGLGYRISDGVMTIVGYVGTEPNPVIPKTITTEGRAYPVESIGIEAFLQAEITGVTISEGVRYIDDRCFAGCTKLQKIVMPDSVNQMGKELFDGCSMLGEVVMSKNVTEIGPNTFRGCSALNSVTIYQNVTTIDANAFANVPANMTIRGYTGSYAETFAKGKSYPFESIGTTAFETMELNRVHSAPVTGITTFRFVPKEKGAYTVTAYDLGEYYNRVEVLDSNGRMLADTFSYNQGGNSLSAELTANTTYYIRCTLSNYGQGAEKYSVTLNKEKTVDGYAYRVLTQGTESEASIMLYAGSAEHLTIPNTLEGYPVKTIAGGAFSSSAVLSVTTP